jgi:hypothetical protein
MTSGHPPSTSLNLIILFFQQTPFSLHPGFPRSDQMTHHREQRRCSIASKYRSL